jgi:hypothetical protein
MFASATLRIALACPALPASRLPSFAGVIDITQLEQAGSAGILPAPLLRVLASENVGGKPLAVGRRQMFNCVTSKCVTSA